jgi:monoamine oxidase
MPHGSVIKIQAVYHEPFWRRDGLAGTGFSTDGPVSYTADGSPADGRRGVLVGFIESRRARALADADVERIRATALDGLAAFVGDEARSPADIHVVDWSADPWTRGCYSGHVAPGAWTAFGRALREPCGPIHWAGTETAVRMCGYMDGAVESGRRAAAEVLAALGSGALRP